MDTSQGLNNHFCSPGSPMQPIVTTAMDEQYSGKLSKWGFGVPILRHCHFDLHKVILQERFKDSMNSHCTQNTTIYTCAWLQKNAKVGIDQSGIKFFIT